MSFLDQLSATTAGRRGLASARLRYRVQTILHEALSAAGLTQTALAERLGVRKSAVSQVMNGSGNLRLNTLAEYLDSLNVELVIDAVPSGTARAKAVEGRRSVEKFHRVSTADMKFMRDSGIAHDPHPLPCDRYPKSRASGSFQKSAARSQFVTTTTTD